MNASSERRAIVWCDGAFLTPEGKTAHGLVRHTHRYTVLCVIDARHAGGDAGQLLDGKPAGIPVVADFDTALALGGATHLVVGLAPDGGRLPAEGHAVVQQAIEAGLHVDCGLHDFLTEDRGLAALAAERGVVLTDVRKTPPREALHAFTGRIEEVGSLRIAMLGTDSAVGKRTTAALLVQGLEASGVSAQMIGTGQTAWMQGVKHGIILDSLINDFVAGELENAVLNAWDEDRSEVIVVEGQGSLMNPAYPGGFEILAATRPHVVVLQHAPARRDYDGFPGYPIHPLRTQIEAHELLSGRPVVAITLNHEDLTPEQTHEVALRIQGETGLPVFDVVLDGPDGLVELVRAKGTEWKTRR